MMSKIGLIGEKLEQLDEKAADLVGRAGVKLYGALGGEAAAQDEEAAIEARKAHNWAGVVSNSLQVDADIGRHLMGRDRKTPTR